MLTYNLQALLNIFWHVSSPFSGRHLFDALYCANILAGGKHAEDNPFDPSESATSCNLVFQLCKYYLHTYSFLLLSYLHHYFLISNRIIFPVSQCAASHFPKKEKKERLLQTITRWLHYRTGFHSSHFPDLQTISLGPLVCNIFGLNCISATKCNFHIFNFLLSMLQYNSTPFKFIVQKSRWGLNSI